jgi:hypothetical protein
MGIRDFFSSVRDSFKAATSSNTAASDRNTSSNRSNPSTRTGRVTQNILSDIALGFGNTTGVSQAGIDDYNKRTQETIERMKDTSKSTQDDSSSSAPQQPVIEAKPEPEPEPDPVIEEIKPDTTIITDPPVKLTPVTEPDPVAVEKPEEQAPTEGEGAPTEPDTGAGTTTAVGAEEEADTLEEVAKGDAEEKVADTIRSTGRRSTIQTTSKGLLTEAPTRKRRSLMGGGLIK